MGMPIGVLPLRYLGVPLSHKKLSVAQCFPLVERISKRILHLTAKNLPYAARLVLIKSVLVSIKNYWSQLFLIPKKVIKKLKGICRDYLWQGSIVASKKAWVAWDKVCLPTSCRA